VLRLLERRSDERLRREQRLKVDDPEERSPSHEDRTVLVKKRVSAGRVAAV